jgi:hypothetical protein
VAGALDLLRSSVLRQYGEQWLRRGYHAGRTIGLDRAELELSGHTVEPVLNGDRPVVQVDVLPAETERFAPT